MSVKASALLAPAKNGTGMTNSEQNHGNTCMCLKVARRQMVILAVNAKDCYKKKGIAWKSPCLDTPSTNGAVWSNVAFHKEAAAGATKACQATGLATRNVRKSHQATTGDI